MALPVAVVPISIFFNFKNLPNVALKFGSTAEITFFYLNKSLDLFTNSKNTLTFVVTINKHKEYPYYEFTPISVLINDGVAAVL
jgi:hypothetical protein